MKKSLSLNLNINFPYITNNDNELLIKPSLITKSSMYYKIKMFKFNLTYDNFRTIYTKINYYRNKNRKNKYKIMKPKVLVCIINEKFLKEHKFMCIFINKKSYVDMNTNRSNHYLSFKAKFKDKNSGDEFFSSCDSRPIDGESLEISVLTRNPVGRETQNLTKILLKDEKLINIEKYLKTYLSSNRRKENVIDLKVDQFSTSDDVQRKYILHTGKEDTVNTNIEIINVCPVQSLLEHKYNSNHSRSIHSISFDPFIAHFWSSNQLVIYKDISKKYRKISIKVTSNLIKKLERTSLNLLSSDILLYEIIMNTGFGYIPVAQMLSEKYDTLTIFYWISKWMACGIKSPNEVVCDFSKVLISAISRAFCNGNSLHMYNENCFRALHGHQESLPPCFIHINVAHIMKIFCRIKCLSRIKNKNVKEFYMQSLQLISTCESLSEFDIILEAFLTIILSKTDGWSDENESKKTVAEEKREFILNRIRGLEIPDVDINMSEDEFVCDIKNMNNENHDDERKTNEIANHIKTIYEKSKINASVKGYRLSEYFLPDLATSVLHLCNDFPLWTNVMKLKFNSPYNVASSIVAEKYSYLKKLKTETFKFNVRPIRADQFILTYLNNIEFNLKTLYDSQLRHSHKLNLKHINDNSAIDCFSTLYAVTQNKYSNECYDYKKPLVDLDNWCDQKNNNQMIPEINKLSLKNQPITKSLLLNGNSLTPVTIGENKYFINNTCPFDSVAVIIATAYIDNLNYKLFIDASNDKFLTFCKELTTNSTSGKTYVDRGILLKGIFPEHQGIDDVKLINSKCNVSFIITSLLKNAPSASEHIFCSNSTCTNDSKIISCPSIIVQLKEGFESLEVDLHYYIMCQNKYKCIECNGIIKSFRDLHGHLFIETDVDGDQRQFKLNDFPLKVEINNIKLVLFMLFIIFNCLIIQICLNFQLYILWHCCIQRRPLCSIYKTTK